MRYLVITTLLVVAICFGANLVRAPRVEIIEVNDISESITIPKTLTTMSLDQHIIYQIPDLRSTAGSAGKNIVFAEDGQSVAVIYGRYSGDPDNIMVVYVTYSTDRGNTWIHYGPLSTYNCRRAYSGVDAEDDFHLTGRVYFAWSQAARHGGVYDTCRIYSAEEVSYPDGLITAAFQLPNSGTEAISMPCIGVRDSVLIITGGGNIWRSIDLGSTWDTGRIFIPDANPHFRFGSHDYVFFQWLSGNNYWPYYCESFDYGETWTQPQLLWGNYPPYQNMSNVVGSWYGFDCEVVRDTPVATIKLSNGNYDYGEIWVYRPDSGVAGNWHFKGKKLVGGNSTVPEQVARFPTIAADDSGNCFIGYQAYFEIPGDTVFDIGLFARPAIEDSWYDWGRITFNGNAIEENHLEFAHNAPLIANGDSSVIGMIYHNAATYPTTGNLYFDFYILPNPPIPPIVSIDNQLKVQEQLKLMVLPNPFHKSVKFIIPPNISKITLAIFDISGKLIQQFTGDSEMIWDGRKNNGRMANPGVYFFTIATRFNKYQGKIVLTK